MNGRNCWTCIHEREQAHPPCAGHDPATTAWADTHCTIERPNGPFDFICPTSATGCPGYAPTLPADVAEVLRECVALLGEAARVPPVDPACADAARRAGLQHGFGALMHQLSREWRQHLVERGGPAGGEFVAGPCRLTVDGMVRRIGAILGDQPGRAR